MATRMLIDARHPEETRVAVLKGNRIEEFDFESADRKQIKGNIYLAKVTRVEPSLQAAFVDFGGNRHGFLAFSEIHPDYYQIPKEDREALLAEEAAHAEEEAALLDASEDDEDSESEALADDLPMPVGDLVLPLTRIGSLYARLWLGFLRPRAKQLFFRLPAGLRQLLVKKVVPMVE